MTGGSDWDVVAVAFDDERAVADAGIVLAATLAQRLGIEALVDNAVCLGDRPGAANAGAKVMTLVSAMALGADCIDDLIVPTKSATRTKKRTLAPRQGPEAERIDALLDTPDGAALYRQRQHIIETVFARIKFLRGITRFQRRGLDACRAEWQLIASGHNLLKLHTARTA